MTNEPDIRPVLAEYPDRCRPRSVQFLAGAGGFSGANFWKLETEIGPLCLRRWPAEYPTRERLEFIQAVLWHVRQEGFLLAPLPLETWTRAGYVHRDGRFWELSPWLPGEADYDRFPSDERLSGAMRALAGFHVAAAPFPLPQASRIRSSGIGERAIQLRELIDGGAQRLEETIQRRGAEIDWPELQRRATRLFALFPRVTEPVWRELTAVASLQVPVQPCIRDIWRDHVLYVGDDVTGLIDFGAMRAENVAADVARLLGSLAIDDRRAWRAGLAAYEGVRPLSADEHRLVAAFDRSTVLMSGFSWLVWIYHQDREFEQPQKVLNRLDVTLARLEQLIAAGDESDAQR